MRPPVSGCTNECATKVTHFGSFQTCLSCLASSGPFIILVSFFHRGILNFLTECRRQNFVVMKMEIVLTFNVRYLDAFEPFHRTTTNLTWYNQAKRIPVVRLKAIGTDQRSNSFFVEASEDLRDAVHCPC